MAIKDLQARQGKVDIEVEIIEKGESREFQKFGSTGRVCNAKAKDESGTITLSLWNDDIDKVNVGDRVKITNGWVSEWQGDKQLSTGRFGEMEVLSGGESPAATPAPETPAEEPAPAESEPAAPEEPDDSPVEEERI